jgi:hypothetical protein
VAFLVIGFTTEKWHPTWMLFLIIPVASVITDIISNRRDIGGKGTGVVAILCAVGYMLMGFLGEELSGRALWHPGWIIFFAIPIFGVIVKVCTAGVEKPQENGQYTKE